MISLFDTKAFGATFTGLMALGVGYDADLRDWALLVLPLLAAAGYWLIHQREAAAGGGLRNARSQRAAASKVVRTIGGGEVTARAANAHRPGRL